VSSQWHYSQAGAQYGPVSEVEIVTLIQSGAISPSTPVCEEGKMHWQPARDVNCFQVEIYPASAAPSPTPESAAPSAHQAAVPVPYFSSTQPAPGNTPYQAEQFPAATGGGASGKGPAFGIGALLAVCLVLWGAYSFFFGTLSVDGLGEKVFDALVDGDADEYISDCTAFEYSQEKLKKMVRKLYRAGLDQKVEVGKITEGERDRRLREMEANIDKNLSSSEIEEEAKDARERFRRTIEAGMSAGLNWSKAEFEFVDTSEFSTSDSPKDEDDKPPPGFGGGDLYIVISEGGKRYKIEMDDCILVPGYGCLNMDGMYWRGEIK